MNGQLETLLDELDSSTDQVSERELYSQFSSIAKTEESFEVSSEIKAFFHSSYRDKNWESYYDLKINENESEAFGKILLEEREIEYWETRSETTSSPLMKARYSDLVWSLSYHITGKTADYNNAIRYIKAVVELCERDLFEHHTDAIREISRAYNTACSINDNSLKLKTIEVAIHTEDRIAKDDFLGTWGICFDLFVAGKEKSLSDEQRDVLIEKIESRLVRVTDKVDPWAAERAGIRLAKYYRTIGSNDDVTRVIELVESAFEAACVNAHPGHASTFYQHVHGIYSDFDMKEKANVVLTKISELGPSLIGSMISTSHKLEITEEEMSNYLEEMIEGGLAESLNRITRQFTPIKSQIEEQVHKSARDYPLSHFFSNTALDHKGLPVTTVGGVNTDMEGRVIQSCSQRIQISSCFLERSILRLVEKYGTSTNVLSDFIISSPLVDEDKRIFIEHGIDAFLKGDFLSTIHVLIPQVEAVIRKLVELSGNKTTKRNRQNGFQYRTLDDLIRDDAVVKCFGEDVVFYFLVLLTDERGCNLRNKVCHGIAPAGTFNGSNASRLIHVLLCLGHVRESEKVDEDASPKP